MLLGVDVVEETGLESPLKTFSINFKAITMNNKSVLGNLAGWIFGLAVAAAGVVNMFWGNDFFFGVFLFLLSFVFLPQVNAFIRKSFGFSIPFVAKIILLIFIIWAAVGVGELFQKIDLMVSDLS
jgi:lysylphosphatidylglycerol synthetase-like protein (DUF2156 family)